jgi:sphingolipid delta-4 desaturase
MEHHLFQGVVGKDVDIPHKLEGKVFNGVFLKILWLFFQPIFYAVRPSIINHKDLKLLDVYNICVILFTDVLIVAFLGPRALLYLILSTLLGMGLHPVAGHFISEHYKFEVSTHDTFSYYGSLNWICWNVGYHNEHHDFPRVPGWKLPQVKAIAGEFYDNLPQHHSWVKVMYDFVMDPKMNPFSRVVRNKARGNKQLDPTLGKEQEASSAAKDIKQE